MRQATLPLCNLLLPTVLLFRAMPQKKFYLAACCIAKDEEPFIAEWLIYHSLIGVEHFFIYDNFSATPLEEHPVVQKFVNQGRVTIASIAGKAMQLPVYAHCLQIHGPQCKWIAFVDLDEFICPLRTGDMRALLAEYEDYSGLALNWKCFGSSGHLSRPAGLVMQNYQERFTKRHPLNFHVKSIVQPDKTANVHTAHAFYPHQGQAAVNDQLRPLPFGASLCPTSWEKACVNHYILKSQEDAEHRMRRGRADVNSDKPTIEYDYFCRLAREPQEKDSSITRFVQPVARLLESSEIPPPNTDALSGDDLPRYTRLAGLFIQEKRFAEAEILLCHAAMHHAEKAQLWVTRATLARHKGEYDSALLFLKKAMSLDELPQSYEELLDLYIIMGKRKEGRAVLEFMLHASTVQTDSTALKHKLALAAKMLGYHA